jgi:hypothetical protein
MGITGVSSAGRWTVKKFWVGRAGPNVYSKDILNDHYASLDERIIQ